MTVFVFLWVGAGGVLGALARRVIAGRLGGGPRGTLAVNVLGSLALGALLAGGVDGRVALVFATGFCGAFTTFSSFAVETVQLAEDDPRRAVGNAVGTLVVALVAVWGGAWLVSTIG